VSILSEFKEMMQAGTVVDVTNHYITREDHPCFGTNRRTVSHANSSSWHYWDSRAGRDHCLKWPKGSQICKSGDAFLIYGHPKPGDLFMTIRREEQ